MKLKNFGEKMTNPLVKNTQALVLDMLHAKLSVAQADLAKQKDLAKTARAAFYTALSPVKALEDNVQLIENAINEYTNTMDESLVKNEKI